MLRGDQARAYNKQFAQEIKAGRKAPAGQAPPLLATNKHAWEVWEMVCDQVNFHGFVDINTILSVCRFYGHDQDATLGIVNKAHHIQDILIKADAKKKGKK